MNIDKTDITIRYPSHLVLLCVLIAYILLTMPCTAASSKRVLIVTTEQYRAPDVWPYLNGEYVVADLTAAGLPFDVVTYGRFVQMQDLGDHDVIILNGHTSPTPVADVELKCRTALQQNRKVFINGEWPNIRYDTNGQQVEKRTVACNLFDVIDGLYNLYGGIPSVPAIIEKDPSITAVGLTEKTFHTYRFKQGKQPQYIIAVNGGAIGFLFANGGAFNATNEYDYNLVDYGKIVNHLRHGNSGIVGFANDRLGGKPIVSFEVHCDATNFIPAIDKLSELASRFHIPLDNLLVYSHLTSSAIQKWQSVTSLNPLMRLGSHSRNHPQDWPSLPSALSEANDALNDQRFLLPSTGNYFNFSGSMNPTATQIDQVFSATPSMFFGAAGSDLRGWKNAQGQFLCVQRIPTRREWFANLSRTDITPFCLSHTTVNDYATFINGKSFCDEVKTAFPLNVKYGLYNFGYIHDYMMDPSNNFYQLNGTHMSGIIWSAMQYLYDQDVQFISAEELVKRLRDFEAGWIDYDTNADGTLSVTVYRPQAQINQVKIEGRNNLAPFVAGDSVMARHRIGNILYVELRPEVTSTFTVFWAAAQPDPPIVSTPSCISGNLSANWNNPDQFTSIAEYQYAIGSSPSEHDIIDWRTNGTNTTVNIDVPVNENNKVFYLSVRACSASGLWSNPGVSQAIVIDLTPPITPLVTALYGTGDQAANIFASWFTQDIDTDIADMQYAVGSNPGLDDLIDWTSTGTSNQTIIKGAELPCGVTHYVSVKSRNRAGLWSQVGSSGALIKVGPATIANAKKSYNGSTIKISCVRVSAVFPDCIYIEQPDRSSGIKLETAVAYSPGTIVSVIGIINLINNERVVQNPAITPSIGSITKVRPLFLTNACLGGTSLNRFTPGVWGGKGLNNIGLLVTICGRVTHLENEFFYIDDGSNVSNDPCQIIGVKTSTSSLLTLPHQDDFVRVTGISSVEVRNSTAYRLLRATDWTLQ